LAAAKRELGLKAEGAATATLDDSEAGVGVAPAEGEGGDGGDGGDGGMDVEL
jgi:hypothetical protein